MIKTNYIHNGDAISYLKSLPNECVDMIVTDPPYKVTSRGGSGSMGGYWTSDIAHSGKIFEHNDITANDFFADLYRVLKDKSIAYVMCNNVNLIEYLNEGVSVGFNFVKSLIWDKGNKICGRYYMNCFEYVLLFRKGGTDQ